MPPDNEILALPDGRRADVLLGGDPAGTAIVMHHGTPSDATTFADWSGTCAAKGLRLVSISRPGYAGSSRRRGRSVLSAARDVADVLDSLAIDRFVALGWSGGGPHALASAVLPGERCRAVAVLAGVGPYRMAGVDFLAGMGDENVAEFAAAASGEATLRAWMERHAAAFRAVTGPSLAAAFGGLVPPVDRDILQGAFADELAATVRRALSPGFDGWIDDDLAFMRPWGFELDRIRVPVTLWQGELDLMVPAAHGRWMSERIPGARLAAAPGHGHISLVTRFRDEILDDLLRAGTSPARRDR